MGDHRAEISFAEGEFDVVEAAVAETERGRWFLREFSRRNRVADTAILLDALQVLEHRLVASSAADDTAVGSVEANTDEGASPVEPTDRLEALSGRLDDARRELSAVSDAMRDLALDMRELGASDQFCEAIERHADRISSIGEVQDGVAADIRALDEGRTAADDAEPDQPLPPLAEDRTQEAEADEFDDEIAAEEIRASIGGLLRAISGDSNEKTTHSQDDTLAQPTFADNFPELAATTTASVAIDPVEAALDVRDDFASRIETTRKPEQTRPDDDEPQAEAESDVEIEVAADVSDIDPGPIEEEPLNTLDFNDNFDMSGVPIATGTFESPPGVEQSQIADTVLDDASLAHDADAAATDVDIVPMVEVGDDEETADAFEISKISSFAQPDLPTSEAADAPSETYADAITADAEESRESAAEFDTDFASALDTLYSTDEPTPDPEPSSESPPTDTAAESDFILADIVEDVGPAPASDTSPAHADGQKAAESHAAFEQLAPEPNIDFGDALQDLTSAVAEEVARLSTAGGDESAASSPDHDAASLQQASQRQPDDAVSARSSEIDEVEDLPTALPAQSFGDEAMLDQKFEDEGRLVANAGEAGKVDADKASNEKTTAPTSTVVDFVRATVDTSPQDDATAEGGADDHQDSDEAAASALSLDVVNSWPNGRKLALFS